MNNFLSAVTFILGLMVFSSAFSQDDYVSDKSSKVQIKTSNNKKYVGVIVEDLGEKIRLDTEEFGIIVLSKSNIVSQETFDEEAHQKSLNNTKSVKEYSVAPSAFNLDRGSGAAQTHYFGYWNLEKGITDNFSIDMGFTYPLAMPLRIGFKTSVKVADGVRIGLKGNAFTIVDLFGNAPQNQSGSVRFALPLFFLLQANPMVTIGNERSNITLGGSISYLTNFSELGYGGFFGGSLKLSEKWNIYTEFVSAFGADQDFYGQTYSASLGGKYYRSERKVWTFALSSAIFPLQQRQYNSQTGMYEDVDILYVLPLPYIGYRILF